MTTESDKKKCTLHVCTSCRAAGTPREPKENRPGFILFHELEKHIDDNALKDTVEVIPAKCLSVCPRPCGIAISCEGAWTYLFGDQNPKTTVSDIVDCISVYLNCEKGFMARAQRPKSLRSSILGRVPPRQGESKHIIANQKEDQQ